MSEPKIRLSQVSPGTSDAISGNVTITGTVNVSTANIATVISGNTLTLATGASSNGNIIFSANGTENMRITAPGDVGIGTANPDSIGHGGTNRFVNIYNSETGLNSQAHLILLSNASSQSLSSIGSLSWGLPNASATNKGVALIAAVTGSASNSANPSAYITFFTRNTTESVWVERMRITESGSVGIGTSNPGQKLTVNGAIESLVDLNGGANEGGQLILRSPAGGNTRWCIDNFDNKLRIFREDDSTAVNGAAYVHIVNGGNVGINTANPSSKLHIQGTGTTASSATVNSNSLFASSIFLYDAGNGSTTNSVVGYFGHMAGVGGIPAGMGIARESDGNWGTQLRFYTHKTATSDIYELLERMRIDASGRLNVSSFGNQPRFLASRAGDYTGYNATSTGDVVVIYNNIVDNIGSHFNTSTGKFTAPVAGMYMFQASAFSSATFVQGWFVVNGARQNWSDTVVSSTGSQLYTCSGFFYLNANDSIGFHPYNGSDSNATIYGNVYHTWFKGYLIG